MDEFRGKKFLLDSGASRSIVTASFAKGSSVLKTNIRLRAANGQKIHVIGEVRKSIKIKGECSTKHF